jgi:hypothetical protein
VVIHKKLLNYLDVQRRAYREIRPSVAFATRTEFEHGVELLHHLGGVKTSCRLGRFIL